MKKKVLIVEDDPDILEILSTVLYSKGYEVAGDINAEKVENLDVHKTDMILLDTMLNGKNGIEICKKIRSNPLYASIPIVFISANAELEQIVAECKANGYLHKPFELEDFIRIVEKFLPG